MNADAQQTDWLEHITDFAVNNGGAGCFINWPRENVRQYLAFHAGQNTLALVKDKGQIVALGTAIQCNPEEITAKWEWRGTNPFGKILVILDVVNTRKGGLTLLFLEMFKRWPAGSVERVVALRPNKVIELTPKYIQLAALKG
jgi:hypothetical protein